MDTLAPKLGRLSRRGKALAKDKMGLLDSALSAVDFPRADNLPIGHLGRLLDDQTKGLMQAGEASSSFREALPSQLCNMHVPVDAWDRQYPA